MGDFYQTMLQNELGRKLLKTVGLPTPIELERHINQSYFFSGNVLVGCSEGAALLPVLADTFKSSNATVMSPSNSKTASKIERQFAASDTPSTPINCSDSTVSESFGSLVFDATGLTTTRDLKDLYIFFSPVIRQLSKNGRILILGRPHMAAKSGEQAAAMRALEGFSRSLAKEVGKKGSTAQVIYVEEGAEPLAESAIQFILSSKSAYISGQTLTVSKQNLEENKPQSPLVVNYHRPLEGKTALVTGGSRGIGEAIAHTLARDGANVFVLDIEPAAKDLERVAQAINGHALVADITSKETPKLIADTLKAKGGLDIIVHNAGVTRDKTIANMPEHFWDMTLDINLTAEEEINEYLLSKDILNENGRIICVSSMNGIAGQVGQSNYAASKAGVIGYVEFMAKPLARNNITINAVAPGFIETAMTDAIPFMTREVGRRMNSLSQGGKPVDVAEAISFFASPASGGITGNVLRVCGQCLIGA